MIGKILSFLNRKNKLKFLDIKDSFFKYVKLPQKTRFSREAVELNYAASSPFENPNMIFMQERDNLYIWFYKIDIEGTFVIPEAFLICKALKDKMNNGVAMFQTSPLNIVVIKNGVLYSQISRDKITDRETDILLKEFALSKDDLHRFSDKDYKKLIKDALAKIRLTDLFNLSNISLNPRTVLNESLEYVRIPIIAILIALIFIGYAKSISIKTEFGNLNNKITVLRRENQNITKALSKIEDVNKRWSRFKTKEFNYHNPIKVVDLIAEVMLKDNSYINTCSVSGNNLDLWIKTKNSSKIINDLISTGYIDRLNIANSSRSGRSGMERVNITGRIK